MNVRCRLARLILGYRPHRLPEADGVYIVTKEGAFTATIKASGFTLDMTTHPLRMNYPEDPEDWAFRPGSTTGTFSGTIGETPTALRGAADKLEGAMG